MNVASVEGGKRPQPADHYLADRIYFFTRLRLPRDVSLDIGAVEQRPKDRHAFLTPVPGQRDSSVPLHVGLWIAERLDEGLVPHIGRQSHPSA